MLKLSIPQPESILFEAILEPTASIVDKFQKDAGEGIINSIQGKENKVAVGVPYYENLILRYIEKKEEIPHEIKKMMKDYDFHFISLNCSFRPHSDCKFVWVRFGVELSARSKSGGSLEEKPIAYDIFPDEVLCERKYKREANFGPELKLKLLDVVDTGIKYEVSETNEFIVYEPQIFAYGKNTPSMSWDFKSTKQKGIWGNKDLFLIVRAPKDCKIKGRFLLGAEVESYFREWIRIPLGKRKNDKVVDAEYDLSM